MFTFVWTRLNFEKQVPQILTQLESLQSKTDIFVSWLELYENIFKIELVSKCDSKVRFNKNKRKIQINKKNVWNLKYFYLNKLKIEAKKIKDIMKKYLINRGRL
jgi:hypothetical protein